MAALALELADLFSMINPDMRIAWGKESLNWGTNSPDEHVACRSLQVFRALIPKFEQDFLYNLINALAGAVSNPKVECHHHSLDLLLTLNQIVTGLSGKDILESYPQLFWVSLGLLTSVHDWEYLEGLKILNLIIEKIDIKKQSVINMLMSTLPSKWPGGFSGLFIPVSRGLCSSKTEALALQIINSMLFVSVPIFLDTRPAKCLLVTLANLPKLIQVYDYESGQDGLFEGGHSVIESCLSNAQVLATACQLGNCESLSRFLIAFSNQRIKKRQDFFKQLILIIQEDFGTAEADVVKLCMSMLTNSMPVYPRGMLIFLEMLFTDVSQRSHPLALPLESDSGWVRPLISLLSSEHGPQASHLLDVILGGRLKSTEAEIIVNVGGAQNVYGYVRKARGDTPIFLSSGWLVEEFQGEGSLLAKRRLSTVAKSCQPAKRESVQREVEPRVAKEMMGKFRDFERHFRSKLVAVS
jgi:Cell morphogenesis C-terminal/Cell morphogenesis central region